MTNKRQKIWRHNSYFGHARMTQMNMRAIIDSDTTDKATKKTASQILVLAQRLGEELKVRKDEK